VLTKFSEIRSFSVTAGGELKLLAPLDKEVMVPNYEGSSNVLFTWDRIDIGGRFKFQISINKNFSPVYREAVIEAYSYLLKDIKPGQYYWRISLLDGEGGTLLLSKPYIFFMRDRLSIPDILTPVEGSVVNMKNKNSLDFDWKGQEGANMYEVKLYQSTGKSDPLLAMKTRKTGLKISDLKLLDRGKFYWTLQAFERDESGKIIRKSEPVKSTFRIDLGEPLEKPKIISPEIHFIK